MAPSLTVPAAGSGKQPAAGAARGSVSVLLRAEAGAALAATLAIYHLQGGSWWLFALLFVVPDIGMLGYRLGPRAGSRAYNLAHTYLAPAALGLAGLLAAAPAVTPVALIWIAHIAFDRLVGYGLKYPQSFHATHLG